ncbi:MAG: ferredoxin [Candidatus Schekmanbacteria bacterium RBG_13_48_7]|uniref:Ferredoxin n=1 Tax=Candidatus Schekmanbacteria bacterium RBG_13_48_7 TaxID=1817878 RepID=A0A1F7S9M9_9BACT|nr:MAG: ferredoxin [Candidatus Schekmanbacteria bacterium RBG_13_48_7]
MQGLLYLKNVVTLKLNVEKCTGCKMCSIVCPHGVFEIHDKKAVIVNRDACMECGACAQNCEDHAIEVESGVGCTTGIIIGAIRGTEPTCDCGTDTDQPCC